MSALARIALARTDVDISDAVMAAAAPVLSEGPDEDAMEIDGTADRRKADEM